MQILSARFLTPLRAPAAALALCASLLVAMPASAATIFADNFDSGAVAPAAANGAAWQAPTSTVAVTSANPLSGCCSLAFTYAGSALGGQGMAQATLYFPQRQAYWFQYQLFIPSNYYHRVNSGASNNKFLAAYAVPYGVGYQVNLSNDPNGSGGSNLTLHYFNDEHEQTPIPLYNNFISTGDLGKWMAVTVQVAAPTGEGTNDGIVKVWKNGTQIANITNLGAYGGSNNYINEVYYLGWANAGFTNTTVMYIDNVVVADTPLTPNSGSSAPPPPPAAVVPDPPTAVSVQ